MYTEYRFNGTHAEGIESVLCINDPIPLQEGRLYKAISPVGLAVYQSEEATLLTFWDLSITRVIAGKIHSQSLILTDVWEKIHILHTLNKTVGLLYRFRSEKCS